MCTVITEVPATDPLREINRLAASDSHYQQIIAASVLTRLADDTKLNSLVENTLNEWVAHGSSDHRCTAALVYGNRFGRADPERTLLQLAEIGRHPGEKVRHAVVFAVLGLLCRPEQREMALQAVQSWAKVVAPPEQNGLRAVGMELGLRILGVFDGVEASWLPELLDPVDLSQRFPRQVGALARMVAHDPEYGLRLLAKMDGLAEWHRLPIGSAPDGTDAELLRLATLLVPDLRSWARRRAVANLVRHHPRHRRIIRQIFRTACKVQRANEKAQQVVVQEPAPPDTIVVRER